MKIIILAGGSGKRLWPLSKKNLPKQFLKFLDHESLFQKTCLRFQDYKYLDEIFVVIHKTHEKIAKNQIKEIGLLKKIKIIIEPDSKNTFGAILFSFKYLKENFHLDENEKALFLPSDHLIFPKEKFLSYLEKINNQDFEDIVIFGVRPNKIETGYGYIKLGQNFSENFYKVEGFVEKPSFEKAKKLVFSEKYLWNIGMFLLSEKIFKNEINKYCPDLFNFFEMPFIKLFENFSKMPSLSIDYALLEKAKNLLVNLLEISWSDVGSWDSFYDVMEKDENLNVTKGKVFTLNTKKSLIFAKKKLISTIGLENILLVETENAIFLAKKGESQKVKELMKKLQKNIR